MSQKECAALISKRRQETERGPVITSKETCGRAGIRRANFAGNHTTTRSFVITSAEVSDGEELGSAGI